ncbi:MAG: hypothetical protein FJ096_16250 [Deltaproteobacteria bacterium]|nr:hypothetical protein [Deltaproteobacteria bacterium]
MPSHDRWMLRLLLSGACLSVVALSSCRYDPVIAERIRKAPPEDAEGPRPEHRAGQACVDCHSTYEGAQPELAIGGTVYWQTAKGYLNGAEGVFVTINDSAGATYKACTNKSGNFFIAKSDIQGIDDLAFPLTVSVGGIKMSSLIGRERSCAGCHKLASVERIDIDPRVDPATGRSRDSAGAIIIDPEFVPKLERCGVPSDASASSSSSGGAGGAGGTAGQGGSGMMAGTGGSGPSSAMASTTGQGGAAATTASAGGMAAGSGGGNP